MAEVTLMSSVATHVLVIQIPKSDFLHHKQETIRIIFDRFCTGFSK